MFKHTCPAALCQPVFVSCRPSHADLPSVSAPPLPRAELDELRFSDDSRSLGTRDHLPSSDRSANQQEDDGISQSVEGDIQGRLSAPIREQEDIVSSPTEPTHSPHVQQQTPPPSSQAPPSVHRKAHRKTNRRKTSESSGSSRPPRDPNPRPQTHRDSDQGPRARLGVLGPQPCWQGDRGQVSSDHSNALDQTIEEVWPRPPPLVHHLLTPPTELHRCFCLC